MGSPERLKCEYVKWYESRGVCIEGELRVGVGEQRAANGDEAWPLYDFFPRFFFLVIITGTEILGGMGAAFVCTYIPFHHINSSIGSHCCDRRMQRQG